MKKKKRVSIPAYPNGGWLTTQTVGDQTYYIMPGDINKPPAVQGYTYVKGMTPSTGGTSLWYTKNPNTATTNTSDPGNKVYMYKNDDGSFTYYQLNNPTGKIDTSKDKVITQEEYNKLKTPAVKPTFPGGGRLQDVGQFFGNFGTSIADTALGTLGMSNVITEDSYKGAAADQWNTGANITGKVGNVAGKMALNTVVPGAGAVAGMATNQLGRSTQKYDEFGNPIMAGGGVYNGFPNAELEKQEVMRFPDGGTGQVNGPSHNQGGVDVNIPMGTEIFSDRLKHPFTKNTFAKEASKFKTNKEMKVLNNKDSDILSKRTAKLMIGVKNQNLTQLFDTQEKLKENKVRNYANKLGVHMMPDGNMMSNSQMAYGGMTGVNYPTNQDDIDYSLPVYMYKSGGKNWIQGAINPAHKGYCTPMTKSTCTPHRKALAIRFKSGDLSQHMCGGIKKYPHGGNYELYPYVNEPQELDVEPYDVDIRGQLQPTSRTVVNPTAVVGQGYMSGDVPPSQTPYFGDLSVGTNRTPTFGENALFTPIPDTSVTPPSPFSEQTAGNKIPWKDIGYGAMAYAPTAYNLGMGLLSKPQQYNAEEYMTKQTVPYRDIDFKPIQDQLTVQEKIARQNIANRGGGTGNYLSNVTQLGSQTQRNRSRALMEAQQYNAQMKNQADQFNIGLDQANKRTALTIANINAMNKAKKSEFLGKGLEGLSGIAQTNKLMSNKQGVDTMKENLLGDFLTNYTFDTKTKSWVLKQ